jgi:hypothetical protein
MLDADRKLGEPVTALRWIAGTSPAMTKLHAVITALVAVIHRCASEMSMLDADRKLGEHVTAWPRIAGTSPAMTKLHAVITALVAVIHRCVN